MRSPPVLYLGVYNSLEEKRPESGSGSVRITLFAPYWLNNRTGEGGAQQGSAVSSGPPPKCVQVELKTAVWLQ